MSALLSVFAAILSLVSRALALVFSTPRSTLVPTVSLPSAFRAASAWSSADSFWSPLTLALILSFASTVFSLALSHASEVVSLVLSQASEVFSLTVSLASTALSFSVLLSSALMAGMALRLMPSATARAAVASLYMAGPPRGWWVAKPTPAAEAASGLQQLLGNLFHIGRVDLSLVGFHDVADEAADLLGVGDAERPRTLLHEATQRGGVEALGEEPLAELDLEPELGRVRGAALAQLLVLGQRLLELLAVGADHVQHERIVYLAGEALGGAALLQPRLEHPDDVRGARVLGADGLRQRVGQLLLDGHQLIRFARPFHSLSRRTNFWTLPVEVLGRSPNSTAAGHLKCAMCCLQKSMISRSLVWCPGLSVTNAFGRSPHFSSGTATTAHSITAGWRATHWSASMVEMFSPPEIMMSFLRSRSSIYPSGCHTAISPE